MELKTQALELVHEFPPGEAVVGIAEVGGVLFIATTTRVYRIVEE